MGIEKLNPFLKKHAPEAMKNMSVELFKGHRIAIDGSNLLFRMWQLAHKKVVDRTNVPECEPNREETFKLMLLEFRRFIRRFLMNGITPIIVIDGEHPVEKGATKQKRRDNKLKIQEKIRESKDKLSLIDPLDITEGHREELRKYMRQDVYITKDETESFATIVAGIGIPFIQAKGEGEQVCSMLCLENKVSAVYSTDTDNLVYGCKLLITGFKQEDDDEEVIGILNESTECFKTVNLEVILDSLELSFEQFIDLCIMAGCDYNSNIPRVGIGRAYPLIKEHGSIDGLPEKYNKECLKHVRCRQLFSAKRSDELSVNDIRLDIVNNLVETGRDILEPYGMEGWLHELTQYYMNMPKPGEGIVIRPKQKAKLIVKREENKQVIQVGKNPSMEDLVMEQLKFLSSQ